MADVHEPEVRSYNMSQIRAKDTKPELMVRKFLFSQGLRFRVHDKRFPGKPDLVFPKFRKVVFVHGCYWHGHEGCKYFVPPKTRTDWWLSKISRTKEKDKEVSEMIKKEGWDVITIWECELKPQLRMDSLSNLKDKIFAHG